VLVRDPKHPESPALEIALEPAKQVVVPVTTGLTATGAFGIFAGIDQDGPVIRQLNERRERLPDVVEAYGERTCALDALG
jgi:hypothetical protein